MLLSRLWVVLLGYQLHQSDHIVGDALQNGSEQSFKQLVLHIGSDFFKNGERVVPIPIVKTARIVQVHQVLQHLAELLPTGVVLVVVCQKPEQECSQRFQSPLWTVHCQIPVMAVYSQHINNVRVCQALPILPIYDSFDYFPIDLTHYLTIFPILLVNRQQFD